MKNLLIASNVLFLSIILIQACQSGIKSDVKEVKDSGLDNAPIISNSCADTSLDHFSDTAIHGFINYKTAKQMADDYGKTIDKKETKSVWFDLQKLKMFIAYIERQGCRNNCDKFNTKFGIRVYFAKYPSQEVLLKDTINFGKLFAKDGLKANRNTIFFSPTYRKEGSKVNVDFDPQSIGKGCAFLPIDTTGKYRVYLASTPAGDGSDNNQLNHGDLKPPPDGSGAFPVTPTSN